MCAMLQGLAMQATIGDIITATESLLRHQDETSTITIAVAMISSSAASLPAQLSVL